MLARRSSGCRRRCPRRCGFGSSMCGREIRAHTGTVGGGGDGVELRRCGCGRVRSRHRRSADRRRRQNVRSRNRLAARTWRHRRQRLWFRDTTRMTGLSLLTEKRASAAQGCAGGRQRNSSRSRHRRRHPSNASCAHRGRPGEHHDRHALRPCRSFRRADFAAPAGLTCTSTTRHDQCSCGASLAMSTRARLPIV